MKQTGVRRWGLRPSAVLLRGMLARHKRLGARSFGHRRARWKRWTPMFLRWRQERTAAVGPQTPAPSAMPGHVAWTVRADIRFWVSARSWGGRRRIPVGAGGGRGPGESRAGARIAAFSPGGAGYLRRGHGSESPMAMHAGAARYVVTRIVDPWASRGEWEGVGAVGPAGRDQSGGVLGTDVPRRFMRTRAFSRLLRTLAHVFRGRGTVARAMTHRMSDSTADDLGLRSGRDVWGRPETDRRVRPARPFGPVSAEGMRARWVIAGTHDPFFLGSVTEAHPRPRAAVSPMVGTGLRSSRPGRSRGLGPSFWRTPPLRAPRSDGVEGMRLRLSVFSERRTEHELEPGTGRGVDQGLSVLPATAPSRVRAGALLVERIRSSDSRVHPPHRVHLEGAAAAASSSARAAVRWAQPAHRHAAPSWARAGAMMKERLGFSDLQVRIMNRARLKSVARVSSSARMGGLPTVHAPRSAPLRHDRDDPRVGSSSLRRTSMETYPPLVLPQTPSHSVASMQAHPPPAPSPPVPAPPAIDVRRLGDDVLRHIQQRMRIERERRGHS